MLRKLRRRIRKNRAAARRIVERAVAEERDLTADETSEVQRLQGLIERDEAAEERLEDLAAAEERAEDDEDDEDEGDEDEGDEDEERSQRRGSDPANPYADLVAQHRRRQQGTDSPRVEVRSEPLTYERWNVRRSYWGDLVARTLGMDDDGARERLERHAAEVREELPRLEQRLFGAYEQPHVRSLTEVDSRTQRQTELAIGYERRALDRDDTSGGEFVPPLWMIDEFVALSRAGRVTADLSRQLPLPAGTDSINLPRLTSGTTTAVQTADNTAISETGAVTDSIEAKVRTVAGQQKVSLQLLEQSPIAFDEVIFADLAGDLAEVMDLQVLNGSGASGQMLGYLQIPSANTQTYTDASPTVPELYPKMAGAANYVATNRFRIVQALLMHPRRWYWMLSSVDASNRPFVTMSAQGPQNALAIIDANAAEGLVGMTPFGPVYIDPNMPTNLGTGTDEDRVIACRPDESLLWEGAIRTRVLPEVDSENLTVRLQLFRYAAFMPHRWVESTSVIAGTGLVTPTF